jgi:hypothetical protein
MPQAEDKAKRAVDDAFERLENASISPLEWPQRGPGGSLSCETSVQRA